MLAISPSAEESRREVRFPERNLTKKPKSETFVGGGAIAAKTIPNQPSDKALTLSRVTAPN
jgi:hypothetical protein